MFTSSSFNPPIGSAPGLQIITDNHNVEDLFLKFCWFDFFLHRDIIFKERIIMHLRNIFTSMLSLFFDPVTILSLNITIHPLSPSPLSLLSSMRPAICFEGFSKSQSTFGRLLSTRVPESSMEIIVLNISQPTSTSLTCISQNNTKPADFYFCLYTPPEGLSKKLHLRSHLVIWSLQHQAQLLCSRISNLG